MPYFSLSGGLNDSATKAIYLDPNMNAGKRRECQSIDIDYTSKKIFGCLVCNKCKDEYPETYGSD